MKNLWIAETTTLTNLNGLKGLEMVSTINISNGNLESVVFPSLTYTTSISISGQKLLVNLSFPELQSLNGTFSVSTSTVADLSMPLLTSIRVALQLNSSSFTTISMPSLVSIGTVAEVLTCNYYPPSPLQIINTNLVSLDWLPPFTELLMNEDLASYCGGPNPILLVTENQHLISIKALQKVNFNIFPAITNNPALAFCLETLCEFVCPNRCFVRGNGPFCSPSYCFQ